MGDWVTQRSRSVRNVALRESPRCGQLEAFAFAFAFANREGMAFRVAPWSDSHEAGVDSASSTGQPSGTGAARAGESACAKVTPDTEAVTETPEARSVD